MAVDVKVPSVGESINEVFIGTWLKNEGDAVEKDEPLVEVETDKATLEVPATASGVLESIAKGEGESATVGEVIATIAEGEAAADAGDGEASGDDAAADGAATDTDAAADAAANGGGGDGAGGHVMPAAQRLADEHGLDAASIEGTGPGGRVLKEDVQRAIDTGADSSPASDGDAASTSDAASTAPGPSGPATPADAERIEEAVPMSPLRRTIARRLVEAQQTGALLTTFNEIDMTGVMELRSEYKQMFEDEYGIRLGFMSFFVKAAIDALAKVPQINAEIRGNDIVYKNYYDIAVAVSTPKGLVTPVVRNAERLSFAEIEATVADFGKRAQANKLSPDELQGGTFTISNGGVFGSLMSTPIVNPPQSGVLGMHTIQERPVAIDGQVEIRPMMYVALTYDHRIVDGKGAVTFLKRIKETVESPARMLLEI